MTAGCGILSSCFQSPMLNALEMESVLTLSGDDADAPAGVGMK